MSFTDPTTTVDGSDIEGELSGVTVTASLFRTAETGPRVEMGNDESTSFPDNETRYFSDSPRETRHAFSAAFNGSGDSPSFRLASGDTATLQGAKVTLVTDEATGESRIEIEADRLSLFVNDEIDSSAPLAMGGNPITNADLSDPSNTFPADQVYSVAYSGTTDASGFLTVTHGGGFTPSTGWAMTTNPNSSFAQPYGIDSLGATTVRLRFANVAGTGAAASTAVAGRLFLLR